MKAMPFLRDGMPLLWPKSNRRRRPNKPNAQIAVVRAIAVGATAPA